MDISQILLMIIYALLIVLLIVFIVLGIKLILFVDKTDKLVDDVQSKVSSFDSVFKLIDLTTDKLSIGITNLIESFISMVNRIFKKRKDDSNYE